MTTSVKTVNSGNNFDINKFLEANMKNSSDKSNTTINSIFNSEDKNAKKNISDITKKINTLENISSELPPELQKEYKEACELFKKNGNIDFKNIPLELQKEYLIALVKYKYNQITGNDLYDIRQKIAKEIISKEIQKNTTNPNKTSVKIADNAFSKIHELEQTETTYLLENVPKEKRTEVLKNHINTTEKSRKELVKHFWKIYPKDIAKAEAKKIILVSENHSRKKLENAKKLIKKAKLSSLDEITLNQAIKQKEKELRENSKKIFEEYCLMQKISKVKRVLKNNNEKYNNIDCNYKKVLNLIYNKKNEEKDLKKTLLLIKNKIKDNMKKLSYTHLSKKEKENLKFLQAKAKKYFNKFKNNKIEINKLEEKNEYDTLQKNFLIAKTEKQLFTINPIIRLSYSAKQIPPIC